MDFITVIDMIVDDLRHCNWAVKEAHPPVYTTWGLWFDAHDRAASYMMRPPNTSDTKTDNVLFYQAKNTPLIYGVYSSLQYKAGRTGPIFQFDGTASSQQVRDKLLYNFTDLDNTAVAKIETKIWTLREAYEQNKTQQQCCVCGKPTETRSLCTSNVQYCRCIEGLKA